MTWVSMYELRVFGYAPSVGETVETLTAGFNVDTNGCIIINPVKMIAEVLKFYVSK